MDQSERTRGAFLAAGAEAARLLGTPEVASAWDEASALEGWNVSGLAGHLARAVLTVPRYLDGAAPPAASDAVDAAGYVLTAVEDDDLELDSELYTAIRARGDREATVGPGGLAAVVRETLASLVGPLLGGDDEIVPGSRLVAVLDGITMELDDYLATRVVELAVHLDDLAVSVGLQPTIPVEALDLATELLVELARRRRGDLTVLRALARRERAPEGPIAL